MSEPVKSETTDRLKVCPVTGNRCSCTGHCNIQALQNNSMRPETTEPDWSDAEYDEILRLHIIEGYTISEAKRISCGRRQAVVLQPPSSAVFAL